MIRLKEALNYRGTIIEAGTVVGFLPPGLQDRLIKSKAAELVKPETEKTQEKPLEKKKKAELLEIAAGLGIEGLTENTPNEEIIEAIRAKQQPAE